MTLATLVIGKISTSRLVENRCVFDSGTTHSTDLARRGEENTPPPYIRLLNRLRLKPVKRKSHLFSVAYYIAAGPKDF